MRKAVLLTITMALILCLASTTQAVTYTVTDLGTVPGMSSMQPKGISDTGYVVGQWYVTGSNDVHSFAWHDGAMTNALASDGSSIFLTGVNNSGQASGHYYNASTSTINGVIWQNGTVTELGTLGGRDSLAYGINNAGQVTGQSTTSWYPSHGFIWEHGVMTSIDPNEYLPESVPAAINEAGDIVGWMNTDLDAMHAFLWSDGVLTEISPIGGFFSRATDINDLGWVVGRTDLGVGGSHAFLWRSGTMEDLGSLSGHSAAYGVNNLGQVIGASYPGSGPVGRAFIWEDGIMQDLNDLIAPGSGWYLSEATATNNLGWIVGTGTLDGESRGYLLIPVPEPSGMPALSGGVLAILGLTRRKRR